MFEIKSFESKMSLISEFEFLIFSLFESIALCVYLKKTILRSKCPPKKYSLGIFFINSILFGFDVNFYFKYLLSSNRFFPTQIDIG